MVTLNRDIMRTIKEITIGVVGLVLDLFLLRLKLTLRLDLALGISDATELTESRRWREGARECVDKDACKSWFLCVMGKMVIGRRYLVEKRVMCKKWKSIYPLHHCIDCFLYRT